MNRSLPETEGIVNPVKMAWVKGSACGNFCEEIEKNRIGLFSTVYSQG